jgi:aryl-alcohol dehydrogenase-like predicted oxidoreductase
MHRRDFLKTGAAGVAGLAIKSELFADDKAAGSAIPKRLLGKTGEQLSILGFSGTAVMSIEQSEANSLVSEAFDLGVNYYDVSPTYGNAQERLGPALEPYRKHCFLASKTDFRSKAEAEADVHKSLQTLRTDHFDLFQHHAVDKMSDLDQIFGPNGAQEAFVAVKKSGKVRFLGLSTHSPEVALAAMKHGGLDTIMFPINYVLVTKSNFGPDVMKYANENGLGFIAIKAMARGKYSANLPEAKRTPKCWYEPCTLPEEAALAYRWTLSKPVTAAMPPGNPDWFRVALKVAQDFKPITEAETKALLKHLNGADPLFPQANS